MAPAVKHAEKPDTKTKARSASASAASALHYQPGFGNQFRFRSGRRRAAGRPQLAAAAAARALCRADFRHVVYHRARRKSPHLDLPHPAVGRASPLRAHRQPADPQRAVQRGRGDADAIALVARFRFRSKPTDFVEGIVTLGGNGDVATQVGMAVHFYAANRSMTDRCLLQCRRRNADRAAAGPRALCHRARRDRSGPRRDRDHPARLALSRRAAGRARRAATSARITAPMFRLPELGPLGANGLANPRDFLCASRRL